MKVFIIFWLEIILEITGETYSLIWVNIHDCMHTDYFVFFEKTAMENDPSKRLGLKYCNFALSVKVNPIFFFFSTLK